MGSMGPTSWALNEVEFGQIVGLVCGADTMVSRAKVEIE